MDDEPGMLSLVQRFAEGEGFNVVIRPGGRALLSELSKSTRMRRYWIATCRNSAGSSC